MHERRYYFTTRDWLMMAALAALGGVASTYINAIGDFFQSILGFAGTTQWAAGLHVLWLTLAVGLTGRAGAGTITGILKGCVELLTGNTHGLLVVLVDIVAGLLVDLGFLPFRDKDRLPAFALAGGLASASNVFVFQLFAALPSDILAYGVLLLVGGMAFVSGVVFAGVLARSLLGALRRAGVVKDREPEPVNRRRYSLLLAGAAVLTLLFGLYLRGALRGPATLQVGGAVAAPYAYPEEHGDLPLVTAESTLRDVTARYTGVRLRDLLERAQPHEKQGLLLIRASDGYAFFVSLDEVWASDSLLLAPQGQGEEATYNIVGAANSKAWVRGVSELVVMGGTTLEVTGALADPAPFDPNDWQFEMDSINLDVGDGPRKVQGALLGPVLASLSPAGEATTVILHTEDEEVALPLDEILADDEMRIFTLVEETGIRFVVAQMDGTVLAVDVQQIEVR
ncbi:MAG: ECF transporter S component [Anaerolineae bacterium]|nr:ECF transporter S component [Anaerolineae bacterium]